MKKMVFALCAAGLVFASCTKEEVKPELNEQKASEPTAFQRDVGGVDGRYYYNYGGLPGWNEGCEIGGFDCYRDHRIVFGGTVLEPVIIDEDKWVEDHANEVMTDYVAGNFEGLAELMDASLLDRFLTGELSLQRSGIQAHGETTYLKFVNEEGVNEFVYPFILE